jgi:hypothetical protein
VAEPTEAESRWHKQGTRLASLAAVAGMATILPWFSRTTDVAPDDRRLEILTAWAPAKAVAATGDGWAGPLRTVPWGALLVAVAVAGLVGALLAKRRAPGDPGARTPLLVCAGSAGLGLVVVVLAWIGAATGVDTDTIPMFGAMIAAVALGIWLALAVAMLRTRPPAPAPSGRPPSRPGRRR